MSPGTVVALIFLVIFIIGVAVGVIAVIALSALRADRRRAMLMDMSGPEEPSDFDEDDITGPSGVPGHWDDVVSGDRPRWPRRDNDHGGRSPRGG
ncbi:MAG TPA: hypothetical protein VF070_34295 [Streptosporangiaceae bacterium]